MARIEISLDEYEGMKERIKSLETEIVANENKIELLNNELLDYKDTIDYFINGLGMIERVFQWGQVVKAVKASLKIYEKDKQ